MKNHYTPFFALALCAAVLTGCRGNVSDNKNGKITEPTMIPDTIATMPSMDTTPPLTTAPNVTTQPTHMTEPSVRPSEDHKGNGGDSYTEESTVTPSPKARPNRSRE